MNLDSYKDKPSWIIVKPMESKFNWDYYFSHRMNQLEIMKKRLEKNKNEKFSMMIDFEKKRINDFEEKIESENKSIDYVLEELKKYFGCDLEDIQRFISPYSTIFKIPKSDIRLKLDILMSWLKSKEEMKIFIANSELYHEYGSNDYGIWMFDVGININKNFEKMKKILNTSSDVLMKLIKKDYFYSKTILLSADKLEKRISKLASSLDMDVESFILLLNQCPYLIHQSQNKIDNNIAWLQRNFDCEKKEVINIMLEFPPFIFWTVSSIPNIFREKGYQFSKNNKNISTLKEIVKLVYNN